MMAALCCIIAGFSLGLAVGNLILEQRAEILAERKLKELIKLLESFDEEENK